MIQKDETINIFVKKIGIESEIDFILLGSTFVTIKVR
jgi:hypothetical protein